MAAKMSGLEIIKKKFSELEVPAIFENKEDENYFIRKQLEIDIALSGERRKLRLNGACMTQDDEINFTKHLLDLRFFSDDEVSYPTLGDVEIRIDLVLEQMCSILENQWNETNEMFLYIAECIARNLYIIKQQVRCTYSLIPWEEMLFCLISFISAHTKHTQLNIFCWATLTRKNILKHLRVFKSSMEYLKINISGYDIGTVNFLPCCTREEAISGVLEANPEFVDLYEHYEEVRDVYSLDRMTTYIEVALEADSSARKGQLLLKRALQVVGEYLKSSLESPNVSKSVCDLILLSAPIETRKVLTVLRNSLSHSHIVQGKGAEEKLKFYTSIQNDIKKIGSVISEILLGKKKKLVKTLLSKVAKSSTLDEINELSADFEGLSVLPIVNVTNVDHITKEDRLIEELFKLTCKDIELNSFESVIEVEINRNLHQTKLVSHQEDFAMGFAFLKTFFHPSLRMNAKTKSDEDIIFAVKKRTASEMLLKCSPLTDPADIKACKELSQLLDVFYKSVHLRISPQLATDLLYVVAKIRHIIITEKMSIRWIDDFNERLKKHKANNKKGKKNKSKPVADVINTEIEAELVEKINELKSTLRDNPLTQVLGDHGKRFMIEMMFLDVLSDLDTCKRLVGNIIFIDGDVPLLTGKCLRNYLAHGGFLIDILFEDVFPAVYLNAAKLAECDAMRSKKIGHVVKIDPNSLKGSYENGLTIIRNMLEMKRSLEEGNLEVLRMCIANGADTNYKSFNKCNVLHLAARGPSLELFKYLVDECNLEVFEKDLRDQNSLYVAAAFGREDIVKFLLEKKGLTAEESDRSKSTPLHLAAQNGHAGTVEILLKLGADRILKDWEGHCPLHYAVRNNCLNVVETLANRDVNMIESCNGFTPLHIAADLGYLEIVRFLLENNADVDAKSFTGATPLYFAALNGHIHIVNALIAQGANINFKGLYSGCTPLNNAAENGHGEVVNILLKHGASVNIGNRTLNQTPLHAAAYFGHTKIVEDLISHEADVNALRFDGMNPLVSSIVGGHNDIVKILLANGSVTDCHEYRGLSPLHLSSVHKNKEIVETLIDAGIDVNIRNIESLTPLHLAAMNGNYEVVEVLLRAGADVNCVESLLPPLHFSAFEKHLEISRILIEKGADVNSRNKDNYTPLIESVKKPSNENITKLLIDNHADVNAACNNGYTALHKACLLGYYEAINTLIRAEADVNAKSTDGVTPLHLAVEGNHKLVVELLIERKSDVNALTNKNASALYYAVKNNFKDLVDLLIAKGADVNANNGSCLTVAIENGFRNVVDSLLRNKNIDITVRNDKGSTLLHIASGNGNWNIAKALMKKGCDVDAVDDSNCTALKQAIILGQDEIVEALIENGALVDSTNVKDLLATALIQGSCNIITSILHKEQPNLEVTFFLMRFAICMHRIKQFNILFKSRDFDINLKHNNEDTLLHVASSVNDVDIVKYLIGAGADVDVTNASGAKPIHLASQKGHIDTVEYFINSGMDINCEDEIKNNLLHHAAIGGQYDCAKYLMEKGVNLNACNKFHTKPLHIASQGGYFDLVKTLIVNGAIYNDADLTGNKPQHLTDNVDISRMFELIDNLYEAVENNDESSVQTILDRDAIAGATRFDHLTLLHVAIKNNLQNISNILLLHNSNLNAKDIDGSTPLHYACEGSHYEIVSSLLQKGAIYNPVDNKNKTPLDIAGIESIKRLLELIHSLFCKVENGDEGVIEELEEIKDSQILDAIMKVKNREGKILAVVAAINKFPKLNQLRSILEDDVTRVLIIADELILKENFNEAHSILVNTTINRILGSGGMGPGTLEVQTKLAEVFYKKCDYESALGLLENIYSRQKKTLGDNCEASLKTQSSIAFVFFKQGKNLSALDILERVCRKQSELLTENHKDVLESNLRLALVLKNLQRNAESLELAEKNYAKCLEMLGPDNVLTLDTLNHIGNILYREGKTEKAIDIFKSVCTYKKKVMGINHSDTMRAEHNIGALLASQKKYDEAYKILHPVFARQKLLLGANHIDTINTRRNIACVHFFRGQYTEALKAYKEGREERDRILGPKNPDNVILNQIFQELVINSKHAEKDFESVHDCQVEVIDAVVNNDDAKIALLIRNGSDVQTVDSAGRTPLHFAASKGNKYIVDTLLKHGADATAVTLEGNTPLHAAVYNNHPTVVEILVKHVAQKKSDKFSSFINAETFLGGATSLHAASKINATEIARILLKNGACYNPVDRIHDMTPLQYSRNDIHNLLKLTEEFFDCASRDDAAVFDKLTNCEGDDIAAVTKARNEQKLTALEMAQELQHQAFLGAFSIFLGEKQGCSKMSFF